MSFVDAFYSFTIDLNDTEKSVFTRLRLKTAKHPYESRVHLLARAITFAHSYREGLAFSQGLYDVREPTLWVRDTIGSVIFWVQVGPPDHKKLQKAVRSHNDAAFAIYFYEEGQKEIFAASLRGFREELLERVRFYELDPGKTAELAESMDTSSNWIVTIVEDRIYLTVNGVENILPVQALELDQLLAES